MIKEASYSLFNNLDLNVRFDVRNIHLNLGDEVADKSARANNLFEIRAQPPSVFLGTFKFHQKIHRVSLPNPLDSDRQFLRFGPLLQVLQYGRVAHPVSGLY